MPSRQLNGTLWRPSSQPSSSISIAHHAFHSSIIIGSAIAGGFAALVAVALLCFILCYKFRSKKTSSDCLVSSKLHKYSYHELKWATQDFCSDSKVGQGGFGTVYKGLLKNGQEIAVKKLDSASFQGERQFLNEMSVIGNVSSPHIICLLGFCAEEKKRLLVYEYMHNGSLQEALFEHDCPISLDWATRFRVTLEIAQGLAFLHTKCSPAIIHGDVKPSNILLDSRLSARIADFGLSRFKNDADGADIRSEDVEEQSAERERMRSEREAWLKERRKRKKDAMRKAGYQKGEKAVASPVSVLQNSSMDKDSASEITTSPTSGDQSTIFSSDQHDKSSSDCHEVSNGPGDEAICEDKELHAFLHGNYEPECLACDRCTECPDRIGISITEMSCESRNLEIVKESPLEQRSPGMPKEEFPMDDKLSQVEECFDKVSISNTAEQQFATLKCDEPKNSSSGGDWSPMMEGNLELSVKKYVMDWMGNNLGRQKQRHSLNWTEENAEEEGPCDTRIRGAKDSSRSSEWWEGEHDKCQAKLHAAKQEKKKNRTKTRKCREWWKEEYHAELSNKRKRTRGILVRMRRSANLEWWSDALSENGDTKKGKKDNDQKKEVKGKYRRRGRSLSTECWSGDIGVSSTPSMRGTVCYVAPEYGGGGYLSDKSDVYSFGVLLLVIVAGRRPLQVAASPLAELEKANLTSWARHLAQSGNVLELVDSSLNEDYDKGQALLCITVALLCLQRLPAVRPNMLEVVKILLGELDIPSLPTDFSPSPPIGIPYRSRCSSDQVSVDFPLLA